VAVVDGRLQLRMIRPGAICIAVCILHLFTVIGLPSRPTQEHIACRLDQSLTFDHALAGLFKCATAKILLEHGLGRLHEWLTIFIPTSFLFSSEQELEFASSARPQLLKPPAPVTYHLTSLVSRFLATAESHTQMLDVEMAVESFQHELLAAAKDLFISNRNSTNRPFSRWRKQVKLVEKLALIDPCLSYSIEELALKNGVADRTLRRSFQRYYGLSRVEYLRLCRLHQARSLLMVGCPDQTTVTKIAFELGFWDLGRFAGAYRELFGELPSATLRRRVRD